eukprot:g45840.t1
MKRRPLTVGVTSCQHLNGDDDGFMLTALNCRFSRDSPGSEGLNNGIIGLSLPVAARPLSLAMGPPGQERETPAVNIWTLKGLRHPTARNSIMIMSRVESTPADSRVAVARCNQNMSYEY